MYYILTSATYLWYKQSQIQKMSYLNRNLLSSENAAPTPRLTPCFKAPLNLPAILTSLVIIMERHEPRSPLLVFIGSHAATSSLILHSSVVPVCRQMVLKYLILLQFPRLLQIKYCSIMNLLPFDLRLPFVSFVSVFQLASTAHAAMGLLLFQIPIIYRSVFLRSPSRGLGGNLLTDDTAYSF